MPSSKITRREVEAVRTIAKRTGRPAFLWDTELKGFGVRVAPSGKTSWLVKKLLGAGGRGSKEVRFVFGDYEELPLERARDQALTLIADIRKGIDLSDRKRQERSKGLTVQQSGKLQQVFELYLQRNAEPGRYWSEIERMFNADIIPAIGKDTLIANITKQELRSLIETKEDTAPGVARFLFAVLRPFFKWCISRDLIASSPLDGLTAPKNSAARDRVLSDFEIKVFQRASTKLGWPFGPFYLLLLLTAQRREEVSGMRWSEIHINDGTWIIPKERTKNGKEHLVHLSPQAIALIDTIERQPGTDFVFTTTLETSISGYSKAKRQLDDLMQVDFEQQNTKPWRVHDLRRTAASGMAKLGVAPHIVERVLNHISGSTGGLVGVYQRHEYNEERKQALIAWSNYIEKITTV